MLTHYDLANMKNLFKKFGKLEVLGQQRIKDFRYFLKSNNISFVENTKNSSYDASIFTTNWLRGD